MLLNAAKIELDMEKEYKTWESSFECLEQESLVYEVLLAHFLYILDC
jgi:hypothetical protein